MMNAKYFEFHSNFSLSGSPPVCGALELDKAEFHSLLLSVDHLWLIEQLLVVHGELNFLGPCRKREQVTEYQWIKWGKWTNFASSTRRGHKACWLTPLIIGMARRAAINPLKTAE